MNNKTANPPEDKGKKERIPSISLKCEGDKRRHYDFARSESLLLSGKESDGRISISEVVFDALDLAERLLHPDAKVVAVARDFVKKHRG